MVQDRLKAEQLLMNLDLMILFAFKISLCKKDE